MSRRNLIIKFLIIECTLVLFYSIIVVFIIIKMERLHENMFFEVHEIFNIYVFSELEDDFPTMRIFFDKRHHNTSSFLSDDTGTC